ncbi:pentapeptide repeat-containing protein [Streptomyces sp. NPDC050560]|uniref:pentapeptide repeat-containing protein n=1 Tax=Streptomyces sp. NPDC050560 TaxID=3365630 RepID=UPI0037B28D36
MKEPGEPSGAGGTGGPPRSDLRPDCAACQGLCCVTLPFAASAAFAVDKPAGRPCGHLRDDFRCGIHDRLRPSGYPGCTVFDCHGAGQKVSRHTFGGSDWRDDPAVLRAMTEVFPVVRQLHELLLYLTEALTLPRAVALRPRLRAALEHTEALTLAAPEELLALDLPAHRAEVNTLLRRAADRQRAAVPGRRRDHRGADLLGARLRGADLRGASLRGALLVAADLSGADLSSADLTGADLRDARLHGARLDTALFLTGTQLTAALGDAATRLPAGFARPAHWDPRPGRKSADQPATAHGHD